jgi:SAM-dependent methyltransferase
MPKNSSPSIYSKDWDRRAQDNARGYIASDDFETEEKFIASGIRDGSTILEFSGLVSGARHERALEIGCGIGRLLQFMAGSFDEVWGADVSPEMLRQARSRMDSAGLGGRVHLLQVSGEGDIPTDGPFDLIYSLAVFQHIRRRDTWKYISQCRRLLRPNGVAVLHFVEPYGLRRHLQALFHIDPPHSDTFHFRYFRPAEIDRLCRSNGLKIDGRKAAGVFGFYRVLRVNPELPQTPPPGDRV